MPSFTVRVTQVLRTVQQGETTIEADDEDAAMEMAAEAEDPKEMEIIDEEVMDCSYSVKK